MAVSLDSAFLTVILLSLIWLAIRSHQIPKGLRLPPGPARKPISGNAADMPKERPWETYTKWAREYGDLVYIKVFNQSLILVNSQDIAHDLFERRSSVYSDRFDFPMVVDLMGLTWLFALTHYGDRWRRHRKAFHQKFHPTEVVAYHSIQTKRARDLLRRLHESPGEVAEHLLHLSGAIIMEIIYGIQVLPKDDPYIDIAERTNEVGSAAAVPGAFLVDTLPILKYVPEWVPGAGFQKKARIWRQIITQMPQMPFMAVKEALKSGTAEPSFAAFHLERLSRLTSVPSDEEEIIRNASASAYAAGADTTTAALWWFILAMVLYPDAQRKAQAEIDAVIGMDRLPEIGDRAVLPYIDALCKEIQRWHTVLPLALPHRLMRDDVYGDYFLPKGSIVIGNSWAMLHDENIYGPKPDEFDPSRFLKPGVPDPASAFGFGRRICPGRYMAENTVFISACSILQVFDISPELDADGNEINIDISKCTSGAVSRPDPFPCRIVPRSAAAERLLAECSEV